MLQVWTLTIGLALQTPPAPPPQPQAPAAPAAAPSKATDAEAWPDDRPLTHLFQNLVRDIRALPSPATAAILGAGGGAALAFHPKDDDLAAWADRHGGSSYSRLGGVLGDAWTQAAGAIGTYAVGKMMKSAEVTHMGGDLIRAQALNAVMTTGLKRATDRTRPNGGHHSFPSGHTSASFASAAVLHSHYGWEVGVIGYATSGFISWTRMRDHVHWLSDGIFGAAIGLIAGHTVTKGHRERVWRVVPAKTAGGAAIYFVR